MKIASWEPNDLDLQLIDLALSEDLGEPYNDVTTALLFSDMQGPATAKIISKDPEPMVVCGLALVKSIVSKIDKQAILSSAYEDGQILLSGQTLLTLSGPANTLLMLERTLLNFLQRLCAIATFTRKFVTRIAHTKTKILDTRKTSPGFRHLEKYAVFCGGGVNHRFGLYDAVMIKDTHIDLLGGMECALAKLPDDIIEKFPVIIEVRNLAELSMVLSVGTHKITRVLLDNMSKELIAECVTHCQGVIPTEASGNMHLENICQIAETGVDFISVGKLTHSAGSVDLSMQRDL